MSRLGIWSAAIGLFILVGGSSKAEVDPNSSMWALEGCTAAAKRSLEIKDYYLAGMCLGNISGISYTLQGANLLCPPGGVTLGQMVRVVLKYLNDNPSRLNEPFQQLATNALKSSWPCKQ